MDQLKKHTKHWNEGYVCLPNSFGDDVSKNSHFRILFKIATFHYCDEKELSITYIEKIANVSRPVAIEGLRELRRLGYIKKAKEHCSVAGRPASYIITRKAVMKMVDIEDSEENKPGGGEINKPRASTKKILKEVTIKRNNYKRKEEEGSSSFLKEFQDEYEARCNDNGLEVEEIDQKKALKVLKTAKLSMKDVSPYLDKAFASPFLLGQNKKGWRLSLLWLLRYSNRQKVMQGVYEKWENTPKKCNNNKTQVINEIKTAMIQHGKASWNKIDEFLSLDAQKIVNNRWCQLFHIPNDFELTRHLTRSVKGNAV